MWESGNEATIILPQYSQVMNLLHSCERGYATVSTCICCLFIWLLICLICTVGKETLILGETPRTGWDAKYEPVASLNTGCVIFTGCAITPTLEIWNGLVHSSASTWGKGEEYLLLMWGNRGSMRVVWVWERRSNHSLRAKLLTSLYSSYSSMQETTMITNHILSSASLANSSVNTSWY